MRCWMFYCYIMWMVLLALTGIILVIKITERIYSASLRWLIALSYTILFQNCRYHDFVSEKIHKIITLRTMCIDKANKDTLYSWYYNFTTLEFFCGVFLFVWHVFWPFARTISVVAKNHCVIVKICPVAVFVPEQLELFCLWKSVRFCTRGNPIILMRPLLSRHYLYQNRDFCRV